MRQIGQSAPASEMAELLGKIGNPASSGVASSSLIGVPIEIWRSPAIIDASSALDGSGPLWGYGGKTGLSLFLSRDDSFKEGNGSSPAIADELNALEERISLGWDDIAGYLVKPRS